MPDYEYIALKLRRNFSLAKIFEEHHLNKVDAACKKLCNEKDKDYSLRLTINRMDEDSLSDSLRPYINTDVYVGLIGSFKIMDNKTKNYIECFMPQDPQNLLSIWFNGEHVQMHKDEISLKDFTPQYIEKIVRYLLENYKRSLAPSIKVLRDRKDIKKEIKTFTIIAAVVSLVLMYNISFLFGLIFFLVIVLFLNYYYPKLDIHK